MNEERTIDKLLRQQAALATFGGFAFGESDLQKVLSEAARICAESMGVSHTKICRHRPSLNDLLVVAGYGWDANVVGNVVSQSDETSTQGRAFITGKPVILADIRTNNSYHLPDFYAHHKIVSTVDVLIKGNSGIFGVLEADNNTQRTFDEHDINFLTGFANVVAEAVGTSERTATLEATLVTMRKLVSVKEELIEEKNVLASELQHRVRNNLQLVYGMLLRQIEGSRGVSQEGIRTIARRVMSLAAIYDHLLGQDSGQAIDFGAYLTSLCKRLHEFQEKGAFEISLKCTVEPMVLELDLVTSLGIILSEITSNAYLHAFPERGGEIRVRLVQKGPLGIMTIADDGVGFVEQGNSNRHGVGLITRMMEQAKGKAELKSDHGTVWTLTFPIPASSSANSA